jgi:DNA-binding NarL/FixJ family response regulator
MAKARVLIADDHDLFRQGLVGLINNQPDMQVVGLAGDGLEALTKTRDLRPNLIIMDVNMPISDGLEATQLIRAEYPAIPILILTILSTEDKLFEAIKAGANGYLLKDASSDYFLKSIRSLLAGEVVIPPRMGELLFHEFARIAKNQPSKSDIEAEQLSLREKEVLTLVSSGSTDKEIAKHLSLSIFTVKSHLRNILSKLHAINRHQAVNLARSKGLLGRD